jgi:hypothetical protein
MGTLHFGQVFIGRRGVFQADEFEIVTAAQHGDRDGIHERLEINQSRNVYRHAVVS